MWHQNTVNGRITERGDGSGSGLTGFGPRVIATGLLVFGSLAVSGPVEAQQFVRSSIDTTISHGLSVRIQDQDPGLLADVNGNDGNYNYEPGIISNTSKFTVDVDVGADRFGLFGRVTGFVDYENRDGKRDRTQLSPEARDIVGNDIELLDLYGTWALDFDNALVDLRFGRHVLNWGESTFILNGIGDFNPIDVSKLRLPGAELREGLLPVAAVSATIAPSDTLSVEGFYQFDWEPTQFDPVGTYFSTVDYAGAGGYKAAIPLSGVNLDDTGLGPHSAIGFEPLVPLINADLAGQRPLDFPDPDFLSVHRGPDRLADDQGQYGIAVRTLVDELNGAEFGFYAVRYHAKLPLISARTPPLTGLQEGLGAAAAIGAPTSNTTGAVTQAVTQVVTQRITAAVQAGLLPAAAAPAAIRAAVTKEVTSQMSSIAGAIAVDRYADHTRYFQEYPEGLPLLGVSFNTQAGNWAIQGEYSLRPNAPLQRAEESLFADGLRPILQALALSSNPAALGQFLAGYRPFEVVGYVERNVSQAQTTLTRAFGPTLGASSMILLAEGAVMHVHDMPDRAITPLESPAGGVSKADESADATSLGYRLAARLEYNNVIGALNLYPYLQFRHDVWGNSPSPIGQFAQGRIATTIGLKADLLSQWEFDIGATFHSGDSNELSDRDYIYTSLKYSF